MSKRFDRLLKLAERTGNPLIIYDREAERDLVVMDVGEYEMMLDMQGFDAGRPGRDVRELSESELLDKINRDIAIWRSGQEPDDTDQHEIALEEEQIRIETAQAESQAGDTAWHRAGDVLKQTYPEVEKPEASPDGMIRYEPAGEPPIEGQSIPQINLDQPEPTGASEPLDEDPIFFEEPVE